jgi:protein-arginine kinase activator protein McsA
MNPYLSVEIDSIVKVEKSMENLIRNLISALNGEAYEEAKAITDQIIATGDEELIKQAEYINSVL